MDAELLFRCVWVYWGQAKNSSQRKKSWQRKGCKKAKKNIANKSPILHLFWRKIANINKVKDAIQDLKKDTQVKELIKLKPKLDEFFQKLDGVVSGIDLNLNH